MKHSIRFYLFSLFAISLMCSCGQSNRYKGESGNIFGTYYKVSYDGEADLSVDIKDKLHEIDMSLNAFNDSSTISRINRNENVETDVHFEKTYKEAVAISSLTQGAFDITIAPLVNLWGFGFKNREQATQHKIDSLLQLVNFLNTNLVRHHFYKIDSRITLDCGAIAKGYACDVIADLLEKHGCKNYLVDIGGESVAKGVRGDGKKWCIAVAKPDDDKTGEKMEIQDTISTSDIKIATSGNYRNYYYDGLTRRSHTIDPRTGYPVTHKLLSATVFANSCIRADALATACMVLGENDAMEMIESIPDAGCFFIVSNDKNEYKVLKSSRWIEKFGKR